ncbi:aminoglycoside adenylyltransferase domain-containing protein [Mesorhizobium sp. 1M-11]|uniref:aminoglycoside adenylyltransferase domain-containing protein n=1 Tax=Mesorhizobium sp. 1M-11 TaxID=1529006 RepID=UPI00137AB720|nr:aminoglycoside adenylyltransferase domain-containing protein [Mesorhizobium sp. 1M-11]
MHGASLDSADDILRNHIAGVVDDLRTELGDRLCAVILHGSLAMESFHAPKSDVDLLVLVEDLSADQARRLYSLFERHHSHRPYAGGLEVSVIDAADAKSPQHPLPSLVHFSETTSGWQPWPEGKPPTDEDLLAHLTVARHRGRSLHGPAPRDAIGELPWADYLASVRGDIDWILEDENILGSPYYGILNLCRWAMMAEAAERIVPGKEEAGVWALSHLPQDLREIVAQALAAYRDRSWPQTIRERQLSGGPWQRTPLLEFRDYMRSRNGNREGAGTPTG